MRMWWAGIAIGVVALAMSSATDAKRLGGGTNIGRQQPAVTARAPAPTPQAAPQPAGTATTTGRTASNDAASRASPVNPVPAAQTAAGNPARWLAPLAGIAAGLGLAALLGHLGLSGESADLLSNLMIIGLFAFAGMATWRLLRSRTAPPRPQPVYAEHVMGPNTVADLGREGTVNPQPSAPLRLDSTLHPGSGLRPVTPSAAFGIPDGFDVEMFTRNAKVYFVRLQAAWDAGNLNDIREFTTPGMFAEIRKQLEQRGPTPNQTDVVSLNAQVLGVTTVEDEYLTSVRFHGMLREQTGGAAEGFDEVWNLTKPVQGAGGWVLAGVQQIEAVASIEL